MVSSFAILIVLIMIVAIMPILISTAMIQLRENASQLNPFLSRLIHRLHCSTNKPHDNGGNMTKVIKAPANQLTLLDVLNSLDGEAQDLVWVITEWQAVGDISAVWPAGVVDLETQVIASPRGIQFSWAQLYELASCLEQVLDLSLAAYRTVEAIPEADRDAMNGLKYPDCPIWVELFDSTYWQVYAANPNVLHRLIDLDTSAVAA
jgi:hypothetical protein